MALPTKTLAEVLRRAQAYFRTSFPGYPLGVKKFLGRMSRAMGLLYWDVQKAAERADIDSIPSVKMSKERLTEWANLGGLPNGKGDYGRLEPTVATGGVATLTGVKGTSYAADLTATAEDGSTQVKLTGTVAIPGSGTGFGLVTGQFEAVTKGTAGNLPIGTVCTWDAAPSGADPTFTLTSALEGAIDEEDNPSTFGRFQTRMQTPPRGGTAEDYRLWAQAAGASDVYIYPKRSGTGSVDILIAVKGKGQARGTGAAAIQSTVQAALAEKRPTAVDGATVLVPSMPNGNGHAIRVRVKPLLSRNEFDWDDEGLNLTVASYTAGPPAQLQLSASIPQTLLDAIDAYKNNLGEAPRIQVISTGVAVNVPIKAVDYSGGDTLTLETPTSEWVAPTTGDAVFAYGPVVKTIAEGIEAAVDSLGPSRASGFGDALSPWLDTLSVSRLIGIAEAAVDSDGSRMIEEVLEDGATIDGDTSDVTGSDITADPPEMLWAKSIAVTR